MQRSNSGVGKWALVLLAVAIVAVGCPSPGTKVFFEDPALEQAVRDALDHPFGLLSREDLLDLRVLNAKGRGIEDLTGIEFCENLTWLDLDTNQVSDLTPLTNLVNLMVVNLDSNEVFDISPLSGLLNLDSLSLFDNQVGDIQALVANAENGGLGPGDFVILDENTMSDRALSIDIPALEAKGVNVVLVIPSGS